MNRSIILAAIIVAAAILTNGFLERRAHVSGPSVVAPPSAVTPDHATIAVLPFTSLDSDEANHQFAAGIEREIITRLAARHVKAASIREPPQTGELLLGSVQRSGNRVRVSVQLVDAASRVPRWAETYDRDLTDVLALQSEIAETVARSVASQKT
jgi:adenylate cyclase